jgi:hypothetical protein
MELSSWSWGVVVVGFVCWRLACVGRWRLEVTLEDAGIHPNAHLFCLFFLSRADRRCTAVQVHRRWCVAVRMALRVCTAGRALRRPLLPSSPATEQEPNQPWRPLYRFVAAGGGRDHYHLRSTQQIHHRRSLMRVWGSAVVFVTQKAHKLSKSKKLSLWHVLGSVKRGISLILLIKYIFEAIPMAQGFIPLPIWRNNHTRSPFSVTGSAAVVSCFVENTSPPGLKLALHL